MLTPRRSLGATAALLLLTLSAAGAAYADDHPGQAGTACGGFTCRAEVEVPGSADSSGTDTADQNKSGGGGKSGKKSRWSCTYEKADPQPDAESLDWEGHKPGDGAVYKQTCKFDGSLNTVVRNVWAADPPEADVDPAQLAQQAVDKMTLLGPEIGITPKPGGKGVVGMPVYLWTAKNAETFGPNVASASAGGITVTATAKVQKIVWTMGDGNSVTCTTAGTPYKPEYGKQPSPDCGYRYNSPSSTTKSGRFHVSATSTWSIGWEATNGQTGELNEVRDAAVDINVAEVQVLN
ncbi:ATP/GTP-binding protein [Streptomyces sp. SGAir0957]